MSNKAINWAYDQDLRLPLSRKAVLVALADHANDAEKCWPSEETLAKRTGCNVRTVKRAIKDLVKGGWIEICRKGGGKVGGVTNRYRLLLSKQSDNVLEQGDRKSDQGDRKSDQGDSMSSKPTKPSAPTNNHHAAEARDVVVVDEEWADILWPDGLATCKRGIAKVAKTLPAEERQQFVDALGAAYSKGAIRTDVVKYAWGMMRNDWTPTEVNQQGSDCIARRVAEIVAEVEAGNEVVVNGKAVELLSGALCFPDGLCMPLGRAILDGWQVETRPLLEQTSRPL